jgi:PAS domain S-box-containing protein
MAAVLNLSKRPTVRYGFAVVVVALSFVLRTLLQPLTGNGASFVLFFGAVLATALLMGPRPGIVAALLSLPFGVSFVIRGGFAAHEVVTQAALFAIDSGIVVYLSFVTRRAQRTSACSTQRVRELLDLAPDAAVVTSPTREMIEVNEAACRLLGYERAELIGTPLRELLPAEEHARLDADRAALQTRSHVIKREWSMRRSDGTLVPVEVSATVLPDGRGQAFIRDITERKRAEDERRVHLALLDSSSDFIAIAGMDGRLLYINPSGRTLIGLPADLSVEQTHIPDYFLDPDRAAPEAISRKLPVEGHLSSEISLRNWQTGGTIPLASNHFLIRDASGTRVLGRGLIARDVSEARRIASEREQLLASERFARQALQRSEQRLSVAMAAADLGLWDWDLIADTAYLSPEYLQLLGASEAEVRFAGTWFRDRVHPDDVATTWNTMQDHLQGKTPQSIVEYRARRESGEYVWLRGIGRVVARDATGAPLRMTGVIVDISEQKHNEDLLRAAIEVRDDVVAIVSHDLRNPLSAIRLGASLLTERPPDLDRRRSRKQLEAILRSAEHMHRIIDKVLDASTIEAGTFALDYTREEVFPIVDELVDEFEPVAASKSIHLVREVRGEVPPIWCDRTRVQQLLSNLIGNALKVVPVHGTIRVRVWAQADEVHFEVADTGPGIPERALSHLFERYWTADPGQRRGTGLGLFISKGIVDAHGGRIFVETKIGEGSTFHFTIPLSPATEQVPASVH